MYGEFSTKSRAPSAEYKTRVFYKNARKYRAIEQYIKKSIYYFFYVNTKTAPLDKLRFLCYAIPTRTGGRGTKKILAIFALLVATIMCVYSLVVLL